MNQSSENNTLTFYKLQLEWLINKAKSDPNMDYTEQIQFTRFALERVSGQKVKINIRR